MRVPGTKPADNSETGRARARRLLRESAVCECGNFAEVSDYVGNGRYEPMCSDCRGWVEGILEAINGRSN